MRVRIKVSLFFLSCFLISVFAKAQYASNDYSFSGIKKSIEAPFNNNNLELPRATCFCVISYKDLTNKKSRDGVCLDLTKKVNMTFGGLNQQSVENQKKCNKRCTDFASILTSQEIEAIASCACSKGAGSNSGIRAFSAIGTKEFSSSHHLGALESSPAKFETKCTCPDTWQYNSDQKKCAKQICDVSQPTSNQNLGNWGFIWSNKIWEMRTANCSDNLVSAAVCKIRK